MDLLPGFTDFLKHHPTRGKKMLLAVSGGLDSVVLCELCSRAGHAFSIAHCNFQLRGEESERDENFVKSLGEKYQVEVFTKRLDAATYAAQQKCSVQEAARSLRYQWFYELKQEQGFSYILLAHHADDNIETLLMNFFRGTGLQGLTGIPVAGKGLLRPLLAFRREAILDYAKQHQLRWVEDSSNASAKYTRNLFRLELIPALRKAFPMVEENLLGNLKRFQAINRFYQTSIQELREKICESREGELRIPVRKLKKYDYRILIFEIIKDFGFGEKQVEEVVRLMDSETGRFIQNEQWQIIKHGLWLIIAPRNKEAGILAIEKGEEQVLFEQNLLQFSKCAIQDFKMLPQAEIAQLDAGQVEFPLILRKWKQGDYFYPLGMRKKKKLARFLIDLRLPKNRKENVWVLESHKRIVWVVGLRIDDRFKITGSTKEVLIITYQHQVL